MVCEQDTHFVFVCPDDRISARQVAAVANAQAGSGGVGTGAAMRLVRNNKKNGR
jgi:hypothetical protein